VWQHTIKRALPFVVTLVKAHWGVCTSIVDQHIHSAQFLCCSQSINTLWPAQVCSHNLSTSSALFLAACSSLHGARFGMLFAFARSYLNIGENELSQS